MKALFKKLPLLLVLLVGSLVLAAETNLSTSTNAPADSPKKCFRCGGLGQFKCTYAGCVKGTMECPGNCLKREKGEWVHLDVAGHSPDELWQVFTNQNDAGWQAWTQGHIGQVVEYQDGKPVLTGPCKLCGGTTRVNCPRCKGKGYIVCPICNGSGITPASWTAVNNPTQKTPPSEYKLRDGRTLVGRITMVLGNNTTIQTEKGDVVVKNQDVLSATKLPAAK